MRLVSLVNYSRSTFKQETICVTVYETVVLPLDYFASRQKLDSNQQYNIVAFAASFLKLNSTGSLGLLLSERSYAVLIPKLGDLDEDRTRLNLLDRQVSSPDDSKANNSIMSSSDISSRSNGD